ncbi:MAG: IS200/IS605 family transposase [Saprospiraceae bacterium]|nr:IS200/IS605 family transposase [Saprospiraceae bacterium]
MANSYSSLFVHMIFVVKYRQALIQEKWEASLFKYINTLTSDIGGKLIEINGIQDHIHMMIRINPDKSVSEYARHLKANSSRWINENKFCRGRFRWQSGYAAFTVSPRNTDIVQNYIAQQKHHHRKRNFQKEYRKTLEDSSIEYDERYLFHPPE